MRVLFLTHSWPRIPGDAPGSFLLHLAVALRAQDVEVRVVAPAGNGLPATDTIEGIPVHRFRYAPRRFQRLAYTGQMAQEVSRSFSSKLALLGFLGAEFVSGARLRREFRPDLVHAHWWFPGGLVGSWISGLADIPLITTMHGSDVRLAATSALGRSILRRVLSSSRAVTTVSAWLAEQVKAMAPDATPTVLPMPVAVDLFKPDQEPRNGRLLFVGRLNAQKGIATLLQAMAAMQNAVGLDVVGDGPDRLALQNQAESLGIAPRINWYGSQPQPRLAEFYRKALALVVPSRNEGFGLVTVEAQLCETPVVAFRSGGLVDAIEDGVTGYLVAPEDPGALTRTLDQVIGSGERNQVGQAARQAALTRYAPDSVARKYRLLYESAVTRRE